MLGTEQGAPVNDVTGPDIDEGWFSRLYAWLFRNNPSTPPRALSPPSDTLEKPKTPYTKLSSFKFRRELGRGAFGRVLLAESKVDGKLYALKIISKSNMRFPLCSYNFKRL